MSEAPVQTGEVLADKYRVERVLGVGGMGVVVRATHLELESTVAIKFMLRDVVKTNPEAVARFMREAKIASGLRSEHVVRVTDVGRFPTGEPYMVMEYLDGKDLGDVIEEAGRLSVPLAVSYVVQACESICEAHVKGIVHRDLKPANMFLSKGADGSDLVKVLDFGISKLTKPGGETTGLTATTAVFGTPLYMSPEQIQSAKRVDARTDIWALGVILYEMLTGTIPFAHESIPGLIAAIAMDPPVPVSACGTQIPPLLEAVIRRALQKNRDNRFPTVSAFARSLAPFLPPAEKHRIEGIERLQPVPAGFIPPTANDVQEPDTRPHAGTVPIQQAAPAQQDSEDVAFAPTIAPAENLAVAATAASGEVVAARSTQGSFGVTDGTTQSRPSRAPLVVGVMLGLAVLASVASVGGWWLVHKNTSNQAIDSATASASTSPASDQEPSASTTASSVPEEFRDAASASDSSSDTGQDADDATTQTPSTNARARAPSYSWPPRKKKPEHETSKKPPAPKTPPAKTTAPAKTASKPTPEKPQNTENPLGDRK